MAHMYNKLFVEISSITFHSRYFLFLFLCKIRYNVLLQIQMMLNKSWGCWINPSSCHFWLVFVATRQHSVGLSTLKSHVSSRIHNCQAQVQVLSLGQKWLIQGFIWELSWSPRTMTKVDSLNGPSNWQLLLRSRGCIMNYFSSVPVGHKTS